MDYVYLDSAATAPIKFFAKDYYVFGNAHSNHALGLQANQALNEARDRIKKCLGIRSGKVLFCRCASEAVEWLCRQVPMECATFCFDMEHESVIKASEYHMPHECFERKCWLSGDLIFHQFINQLTGTAYDIESIGKQVQSTGAFFGSDFTAAIGHYPIPANLDSFCDAIWFSGHKFGCEPGIGAIWLSDRLFKYLGGEEDSRNNYGLLHGTPNVSAAIAMSYAMKHAVDALPENQDKWEELTYRMLNTLHNKEIKANVWDLVKPKTDAINALYLPNFNSDALVQFLSSRNIYVSPCYSACANNADYRVAEALGMTKEQVSQTIRISFNEDSSTQEVDKLIEGIVEFKKMFM